MPLNPFFILNAEIFPKCIIFVLHTHETLTFILMKRSRKDIIFQFSRPKLVKDDVVNRTGHKFLADHITSFLAFTRPF